MEHLRAQIEKYLRSYVGTITHTSTSLENNNITFFENYFNSITYFTENPGNFGYYPIENDSLGRKVPWGLLKGEGRDTVVLIHHTDTVDTDDYGIHQALAYQPFVLTKEYTEGLMDLDDKSRADLSSGDWLFGRGVADMKGGAAIHFALLEEYTKQTDFKGNIVLLGLPDEENLSAGMRSAVTLLKELKDEHELNYVLLLNVEPQEREENNLMRLYDGSVGKLMPIVYVRGKLAHVGQVFNGLNPIAILSEMVSATELNSDFSEQVGNTLTPPPTWLYLKDRKQVYDVSLPLAAAGYMSVLTLDRPPLEIMSDLKKIAEDSFSKVIERTKKSYQVYRAQADQGPLELDWEVNVKTYDELYQAALADSGEALVQELAAYEKDAREQIEGGSLSIPEASFGLIEKTILHLKDTSPMVVLAMSPPYYPHTNISMLPESKNQMSSLIGMLETMSREDLGCDFHVKNYYTGISDLSYGIFQDDETGIDFIRSNMLLWGEMYSIPFETIKEISMPVLNIGPWGKDFHKFTERVYLPDLYDRIPRLVDATIKHLLDK